MCMRATLCSFGDSSVLITTGGMVPAERLFHFQSFNAHFDFSQENVSKLSCRWTPATCYAGLTAVELRLDFPLPSSSFRSYRPSLCWDLQVGFKSHARDVLCIPLRAPQLSTSFKEEQISGGGWMLFTAKWSVSPGIDSNLIIPNF